MEIGSASGGVLHGLIKCSNIPSLTISIDDFTEKMYRIDGDNMEYGERVKFYKGWCNNGQFLQLIPMSTFDMRTLKIVTHILNGNKIDILFIDGYHTYQAVKSDYTTYSPLVADNGIIAFHDINGRSANDPRKVSQLWDEIKDNYNTYEITGYENKYMGIGVIFK
jgi:hypothetical protein